MIYSGPDDVIKNSLVESFNRTIANLLQKARIASKKGKTWKWYNELPSIIKKYNSTVHSTIKAKPPDVFNYRDVNHQEIKRIKPNCKVNDKIRIVTNKKLFQKGDVIRISKAIYMIVEEVDKVQTPEFRNKRYSEKTL